MMPNKRTHQAVQLVAQRLEDTLTQDLGAVDEWLKELELSNYMGLDWENTKGKGREK